MNHVEGGCFTSLEEKNKYRDIGLYLASFEPSFAYMYLSSSSYAGEPTHQGVRLAQHSSKGHLSSKDSLVGS